MVRSRAGYGNTLGDAGGNALLIRATPAHLPLLLDLIREFCSIDRHEYNEHRVRAALPPLLQSDEHGVVWLIGEPPIGYAVVTWGYSIESGGRDALLDEIYLRDRGAGVGAAAVREILENLRERGLSRIFLETERHNDRGRRFYRRLGFVEEDSVWMAWETPRTETGP